MLKRLFVVSTIVLSIVGCGGGAPPPPPPSPPPPAVQGSLSDMSITSSVNNGTNYPLHIYMPPKSAGIKATLPIVYELDGDWWFDILVNIMEENHLKIIIVAIGDEASRSYDYVPANTCVAGGGGEVAFSDFIQTELIPFVEHNVGGDPAQRALLGHSFGGSFVLYALFAQPPDNHHFSAYLASDASVQCMTDTVYGWEANYAASYSRLPVRLNVSYRLGDGNQNIPFVQQIRSRNYVGSTLVDQEFPGDHTGIIPAAFAAAVKFAFPAAPQF